MKRDLDLIRQILLRIENECSPTHHTRCYIFKDLCSSHEAIAYHVRLLVKSHLVDAQDVSGGEFEDYLIKGLTFEGCNFLDEIRDNSKWHRIKQAVAHVGNGISVSDILAIVGQFG